MIWRRALSMTSLVLILAAVVTGDLKIVTHPPLVRLRVSKALAGAHAFGHEARFRHPTSDLGGIHRIESVQLRPAHRRYSVRAEVIEVPLGVRRFLFPSRETRPTVVRGLRIVYEGDPGTLRDLGPFLHFCSSLQTSPFLPARVEDIRIRLRGSSEEEEMDLVLDDLEVTSFEEDGLGAVKFRGTSSQPMWDRMDFEISAVPARREFTGDIRIRSLHVRPEGFWLLPEEVASLVEPLRPRGIVDMDIHLGGGGPPRVVIRPQDVSIRPEWFPYPLRRITGGSVVAGSGRLEILNLRGASGGAAYDASGVLPLDEEAEDGEIRIRWSRLGLSDTLAAAVPEDLGWIWRHWKPTGYLGGDITCTSPTSAFGEWRGSLDLEGVTLPLVAPVRMTGEADLSHRDGVLSLALRGVDVEVGGVRMGKTASGEVRLDGVRMILVGEGRDRRGTGFRGGFAMESAWPHRWRAHLDLSRRDLGQTLSAIFGDGGVEGGTWDVWLRASGGEGESWFDGEVWISAATGRKMPVLGKVFPPRPGEPQRIWGSIALGIGTEGVRLRRIALHSGSMLARGEGIIRRDGRIGIDLVRCPEGGAAGPGDGSPRGRVTVQVRGTVGSPQVQVLSIRDKEEG